MRGSEQPALRAFAGGDRQGCEMPLLSGSDVSGELSDSFQNGLRIGTGSLLRAKSSPIVIAG